MTLSQSVRKTLSWPAKLAFGLGEFGPSVANGTIIPFYFLFFLTDIAGIRPAVAGTILLVARIWDGINDPLVGALSDRTRTRLGRRRPFLLFAAAPTALLYALLWTVPTAGTAGGRALYYLIIYLLFDLFYTLVSGPYYALTPELSLDTDERTSIITYRMAVSIVTGLLAAIALPFVFDAAPSMRVGFLWVGIVVGLLGAIPFLGIGLFLRERPEFQIRPSLKIRDSILAVLRNRPFWMALVIGWLSWLAIGIVEAVFTYYVVYWAGIPEEESAIVLAVILASATLFLPLVGYLARRLEKKWAFVAATCTWASVHIGLWFVPAAQQLPVYVVGFLAGLGVAAAHVLPGAMGADVLEAIEVESGERQEGVFGGLSAFIQKLGTSVALASIGWVLDLTGYVPNATSQNASALLGIRSLVSWVPAALLILAIFVAAAFPITRRLHRQLAEEAGRRREARITAAATVPD